MRSMSKYRFVVVCLVVLCMAGLAFGQNRRKAPGRGKAGKNRVKNTLKVGDKAPDFNLPRLDPFLNLKEGDKDPKVEKVELFPGSNRLRRLDLEEIAMRRREKSDERQ